MEIGSWIYNLFGPYGGWGVLLCIFLIFLLDAILFPTLPEVFFIIGFMYDRTLEFGAQLLLVAVVAEVIGITMLYLLAEHVNIPPRIKSAVEKYSRFLIISDERMLLVNRVAPMLPFAGAFVSIIDSWKLTRALFYVVIGCILKYGALLLMGMFFFDHFPAKTAQMYTIIAVIVVIALSAVAAYFKKKRVPVIENS